MIQIGYYGKTIHRGDFVRFNLPQSLTTVVDDWLQQLLILGENTHQDSWPAVYAGCPAYRFYLSSDIAGANAWFGALVAGTDKVGRRFPFVIAAALPADNALPSDHPALTHCQSQLETLAQLTMAADADFDALQDTLRELATEFTDAVREDRVTVSCAAAAATGSSATENAMAGNGVADSELGENRLVIKTSSLSVGNNTSGANPTTAQLLDAVLKQTFFCYSLWTSCAAQGDTELTVLVSGLPTEAAGLALFDQNWDAAEATQINSNFASVVPALAIAPDNLPAETLADTAADTAQTFDASPTTPTTPTADTTLDLDPSEIETIATSEDWLALEQSEPPALASAEPITPAIETLELDDDVTSAPWDSE